MKKRVKEKEEQRERRIMWIIVKRKKNKIKERNKDKRKKKHKEVSWKINNLLWEGYAEIQAIWGLLSYFHLKQDIPQFHISKECKHI